MQVPSPSLRSFFENYPTIQLEAGERVIKPRDLTNSVIYVKSGFLKMYSISKMGGELVIVYLNANRRDNILVGFFVAHQARDYFVEGLSPVEIIKAPRTEVSLYLARHPEVIPGIFRSVYEYITDLYQRIEAMEAGDARMKVASCIYFLAKEFGEMEERKIRIPIKITHDMISRVCGITRETATTQLSWLRWHGMIEYKNNRLFVSDLESLGDLTEFDELALKPSNQFV